MSNHPGSQELTLIQKAGILVFVFLCGIPALEMNGFGFGLSIPLPMAIACATIGGALGGVMMCPRPFMAGLIGGLLAGPMGLLAVYYYTQHRESVWNLELIIVQGIACIPGIAIGWFLYEALSDSSEKVGQQDFPAVEVERFTEQDAPEDKNRDVGI